MRALAATRTVPGRADPGQHPGRKARAVVIDRDNDVLNRTADHDADLCSGEVTRVAEKVLQRVHQFRPTPDKWHRHRRSLIEINTVGRGAIREPAIEDFLDQSRQRHRCFKIERFSRLVIIKFTKNDTAALDLGAEQHHILIERIIAGDVA